MVDSMLNVSGALLAQAEAAGGNGGFGWVSVLTLWLPLIALFYFLILRPQRQEQSKRQAMLANLKKNDRVIILGGIYGVVTNVHLEADEITVKVDEASNAKLRVQLGAISRVLGEEPAAPAATK